MPIPAADVRFIEVATKGIIASGGSTTPVTVNVFHFYRTTNTNPVSKAHIDTAYQAGIVVPLAAALNNRWTQQNNTVRYIDDALDAPVLFSHAVVGGVAGDGMAAMDAVFILQQTGLRGKSYRGGKHFGPLSEADTTGPDEDILNAAAITRFGAVVTAMQAGFTDSDGNIWVAVVLSTKQSVLRTNPTTVVANQVTVTSLNKRVGRLKRREPASVY